MTGTVLKQTVRLERAGESRPKKAPLFAMLGILAPWGPQGAAEGRPHPHQSEIDGAGSYIFYTVKNRITNPITVRISIFTSIL
jgi:hypothetical protein